MRGYGLQGTKRSLFLYFDSNLLLFTCKTNTVAVKLIMNRRWLFRGVLHHARAQLSGMTENRIGKRIRKWKS